MFKAEQHREGGYASGARQNKTTRKKARRGAEQKQKQKRKRKRKREAKITVKQRREASTGKGDGGEATIKVFSRGMDNFHTVDNIWSKDEIDKMCTG